MKKAMKMTAILYLVLTSSVMMAQEKKTEDTKQKTEAVKKIEQVEIA